MNVKACMDYLTEQSRLREEVVQASKVFTIRLVSLIMMVISMLAQE